MRTTKHTDHVEWMLRAAWQRLTLDVALACNDTVHNLYRRSAHLEAWLNENLPPDYGDRVLEGLILGGSSEEPKEGETTTAYARRVLTDAVEALWEYQIDPEQSVGDKGVW